MNARLASKPILDAVTIGTGMLTVENIDKKRWRSLNANNNGPTEKLLVTR